LQIGEEMPHVRKLGVKSSSLLAGDLPLLSPDFVHLFGKEGLNTL
jgi:hypothetical protein